MRAKQTQRRSAAGEELAAAAPTRNSRKRVKTRELLLRAAYDAMTTRGVDDATIQEITEGADIGFGTFYNYFSAKDDLAAAVLDCVIKDLGRRNDLATAHLKAQDPGRVMPLSIRLTLREAIADPMWKWWVLRPDLLADRMREGFKEFGTRDMRAAIAAGAYLVSAKDVASTWGIAVWMMVGGLRDVVIGHYPESHEQRVVEMIMRMMGVAAPAAKKLASGPLPAYPAADIDFSFELAAVKR